MGNLRLINELNVRYFLGSDIDDVFTYQRAELVNIGGKKIWVPKSILKRREVVDVETGEVVVCYIVPEWWVRKNPFRSKKLRVSMDDYRSVGKVKFLRGRF
jgi:hypothetical protein